MTRPLTSIKNITVTMLLLLMEADFIIHCFFVLLSLLFILQLAAIMSTAKRLVLSLAGRKDSQGTSGLSSTRLVGNSLSPGHELDEIAVVSCGTVSADAGRVSYGSLSLGQGLNGPRYIPGE